VVVRLTLCRLNTRTALPVIRENDIDLDADDVDAQRNVPKVETGVEKAEEIVSFPSSCCLLSSLSTFASSCLALIPPGTLRKTHL